MNQDAIRNDWDPPTLRRNEAEQFNTDAGKFEHSLVALRAEGSPF
jgi:hypothetical protein